MVVVLAVIGILLGVAATYMGGVFGEKSLEEPMAKIQALARKAQRSAVSLGRESVLLIEPGGVRWYSAGDLGRGEVAAEYALPDEVSLLVRPWRSEKWREPGKGGYRWEFEPGGFCEPLSLRLERGGSYVEVDFHPLTGGVADERSSIQAAP